MAKGVRPSPVKLICGAIFASEGVLIKAEKELRRKFGPLDFTSPLMRFERTKYYEEEMGPNLKRKFFSFQRLISPQQLAAIKFYTNRLEKRFGLKKDNPSRSINPSPVLPSLRSGLSKDTETKSKCRIDSERNRSINLDPGYISGSKLVLATCKNYSHRIYLDKGIYAEVTLHFQDATFKPWPWTYPDYKSEGYIQSFNKIREIYLKQLKQ